VDGTIRDPGAPALLDHPMTTISPWPLVRQGDHQHPVKTLQYLLRAHGHNLTADGIFGPQAGAIVRAFQQQKGLAVDGIVGPATWSALVNPVTPWRPGLLGGVKRRCPARDAHAVARRYPIAALIGSRRPQWVAICKGEGWEAAG
jgi:hypothetical protein